MTPSTRSRFDTSAIHQIRLPNGDSRKLRVQDGHLFVCGTGCCCGKTEKGFPSLPLDELKRQWKSRGIRRRFHLTVSGCLGPCTLANVVLMQFQSKSIWFHSINQREDVDLLYDYAEAMMAADQYLEPPPTLASRHFQRYTVDTIDQSECALGARAAAREGDNPDHAKTHSHGADGHSHDHAGGLHAHGSGWIEWTRAALAGGTGIVAWLGEWQAFTAVNLLGLAAVLVAGYPIFRHAWQDLRRRRMTMELSMTIALVSALAVGETLTALVIVFFVLVAEILEGMTVERGRSAILELIALLPATAEVRTADGDRTVPVEEVAPGDVVLVRPGSRVPVDGEVVGGHSFVDQATITGESLPAEKVVGTGVYASTVNQTGFLQIRATAVGQNTAFGRILHAVEEAEHTQAPVQKVADQLAGYLVYFALACAVLTFVITRDVRATISVIIVAGACGIAAGTPLAILGAIGRAARVGVIVKGGRYMEALAKADTIVLDKTGTLTLGHPEVSAVAPAPGISEPELLAAAASAERPTEHPLGQAILRRATAASVATSEPESFEYVPGRGVRSTVGRDVVLVGNRAFLEESGTPVASTPRNSEGTSSSVFVSRAGRYLGRVQLTDVLRPGSTEAIARLKQMGYRTLLLTGDATSIAGETGRALGVDAIEADLLPDQKLERVRALRSAGHSVVMVGDGVNDAPALMAADVGIAMGSGTEVARESASVVLIGDDVSKLVVLLEIARRTKTVIMTNFVGTLAVDGLGVALAAYGYLNPIVAALIHVGSELAFILNSARLLGRQTRQGRACSMTDASPAPVTAREGVVDSPVLIEEPRT